MTMEMLRLMLGLAIALFHQPISDYVVQHERNLVIAFRQRGLPLPAAPTTETSRTIYFCLGICLSVFEMLRIWGLLHPHSLFAGILF